MQINVKTGGFKRSEGSRNRQLSPCVLCHHQFCVPFSRASLALISVASLRAAAMGSWHEPCFARLRENGGRGEGTLFELSDRTRGWRSRSREDPSRIAW